MSNEELVKQIQAGIDPSDNMQKLYNQNYGMICRIARRYAFMDDMDDLLQEAYFGLYEAVKRYEDTAGVAFMSYAPYWIRQVIIRYLENNGRSIRLPGAMQSKIIKYKRLVSACEMQLGRKPTDYELYCYLGVKGEGLKAIKKACRYEDIQSLDEFIPGTDDLLMEDCVPDPDVDIENSVIDTMMDKRTKAELWQIVKQHTTPEEYTVIAFRFKGSLTLEAIGNELGITREAVRHQEVKALRKLRLSKILRELQEKFEVNYARAYRGSFSRFRDTGTSIVEDIAIRNLYHNRGEICTGTMNIT